MNPEQTENNTTEQPVQAQPVLEKEIQTKAVEKPESDKEINWSKFKEARAQERKEAEAMAKRAQEKEAEAAALKAAMEALLNKPVLSNNQSIDEESEEQRIERLVEQKMLKKEQEYQARMQEKEQKEYPQKLVSTFKDFNQVCTTENLDYLDFHYPEVASAFKRVPDSFDKWADVYAAVKRFVPNLDRKKEMARAEQNLSKPQSASKSGLSQPGQQQMANILSDERKSANWERMQKALKGLS
jgi:hypothetical protein